MYACVYMCMYAYACVGMCVCVCLCMYVYLYVYVCMYVCVFACMFVCVHVCVYARRLGLAECLFDFSASDSVESRTSLTQTNKDPRGKSCVQDVGSWLQAALQQLCILRISCPKCPTSCVKTLCLSLLRAFDFPTSPGKRISASSHR